MPEEQMNEGDICPGCGIEKLRIGFHKLMDRELHPAFYCPNCWTEYKEEAS